MQELRGIRTIGKGEGNEAGNDDVDDVMIMVKQS